MATKSQVNRLLKRAKSKQKKNKGNDFINRFQDAYNRGMIFCKDGKERTVKEWIDIQPPYLRDKLNKILEEK